MIDYDREEQARKEWLSSLTSGQLRALASQNEIGGWNTLPLANLVKILSLIEGVEQPQPTSFNTVGTVTARSKE